MRLELTPLELNLIKLLLSGPKNGASLRGHGTGQAPAGLNVPSMANAALRKLRTKVEAALKEDQTANQLEARR